MSLQIKTIAIYNKHGEIRTIDFKLNTVNIITGQSKTGKSSLINIIDYCLGRATFQVAAGVIQDTVEWFAVIYKLDSLEILIAKPKPPNGQTSQIQVYYDIASHITLPEMDSLTLNSNDDAIVDEISRRIGISSNLNIPSEGQTRLPLEATLRHAKFYLFQPQSVVASKDVLFYRQSEPFIPQAIKDTLIYFLGVVQEDRLRLIKEHTEKKRQLRLHKNALEELESYSVERANRAFSLVAEAKQVGLFDEDTNPTNVNEAVDLLNSLRNWQPTIVPPFSDDILTELQSELHNLRESLQDILHSIKSAEAFVADADGYTKEALEQAHRLESINLFNDNGGNSENMCPLCGSYHSTNTPSIDAMRRSLINLNNELNLVTQEKPELDNHIGELTRQRDALHVQIEQKELDIHALIDEQSISTAYRDANSRIARVVGRVSFFLDVTPESEDETIDLKRKIEEIENEIKQLEQQLDASNIDDRKASILNIIGHEMTELSEKLELEHKGLYRLDLKRLTVVVDKSNSTIIMGQNMGSAANHLGSHLIALLGLHTYFIDQKRPVPHFLVLDQPTQVYFPPEVYESTIDIADSDIPDEDRAAVERMFELLFEIADKIGLQIIVLDHANLDNPKFQNAIIDDGAWRNGKALIPTEWYSD